jgi:hypothetical protein
VLKADTCSGFSCQDNMLTWLVRFTNKTILLCKRIHRISKAVSQHAYGGAGARGCIAPTHSRPRHWMWVSGERYAPDALYPRGKDHRYPLDRRLGGSQSRSEHRV